MQSKNSYLIIVVIVLLGLVGFYLFKQAQSTQTKSKQLPAETTNNETTNSVMENTNETTSSNLDTSTISHETEVSYTDSGFTPNQITVKKGDKVIWVNNSSIQMWVASAVHPTHQDYPGFDQLEGVGNGEKYEFVFDKVGTWKYHNHLNASDLGTVVVEE